MEKTDGFIQTYTGIRVTIPVPKVEEISIVDIAHALSNLCRFTGHSKKFYSVGEHCVRVSRIVEPENKLAALLHDASEAYLNDIARPMKQFFPEYLKLEGKVSKVINKAFGITGQSHEEIKRADNILCCTEGRDLIGNTEDWYSTEKPLPRKICPWTPHNAERAFLALFIKLIRRRNESRRLS